MRTSLPYEGLALITDLDGTLLLPDKTLNPIDAAAIADFRAKGGLFGIATGRGVQATKPYFDLLRPDVPAILYNGGVLYDTKADKPVEQTLLPQCAEPLIRRLMRDFPSAGAELLNFEGVFVLQDGEYERKHLAITHIDPVFRTLEELPVTGCCKSLFAAAPEVVDEMLKVVAQPEYDGIAFTRSHDWFLEILPKGVSKGSVLPLLRKYLPAGTVIGTTGDFDNDIEMLRRADYAGCPADAQPIVRDTIAQVGGYCAEKTCVNGFFADWIAQFLSRYA